MASLEKVYKIILINNWHALKEEERMDIRENYCHGDFTLLIAVVPKNFLEPKGEVKNCVYGVRLGFNSPEQLKMCDQVYPQINRFG